MMSTSRRLPSQSSKNKADAEKRLYEKFGDFVIVRSKSDQEQGQRVQDSQNSSREHPRKDRFKTDTTPAKLHRSSTLPKDTASNTASAIKQLDGLPHIPESRTTHVIEKYISRQLSCPQVRKQCSNTLSVPGLTRQNSFDERQSSSSRAKPQIERQESNASISEDKNYRCVVDYPDDHNIFASCYLVSKPSSPPIRTSGTVVTDNSYEMNNNYGNTNGQKYLKVKLGNIRTIPPSGKIEITVELPSLASNFVQVAPCASTVVEVRTHSPVGNSIWITENVNVRNTSHYALDKLVSSPMDFLTVDEGFRPRANSDSRINKNRSRLGSKAPSKKHLPGIMTEDFSGSKTALREALEGQPDDLRLDLDDDAEFFSMLNGRRRRSFTCPDEVMSRPSSAELHRERLY